MLLSDIPTRASERTLDGPLRRPRRALVVIAGGSRTRDSAARLLVRSLRELGIDTTYLSREHRPAQVVSAVVEHDADAVEVCLERGAPGIVFLRELLRELLKHERGDVHIVVHRVD